MPLYSYSHDAGMDLHSVEAVRLNPGETKYVNTGIQIELPPQTEAQVRPRSGLAREKSITVLNSPGTIDAGYRGTIGVLLINLGSEPHEIRKGDKIAQLVFQRVLNVRVEEVDELTESHRGKKGFGSSGP